MSGGGDTPTKTLWKLEGQGRYTFGEFQNGNLYIEGPNSNEIFATDADGQITETQAFIPALIPQLKELFAPYFGEVQTVQILVVSGLAIGDDVPNWEDYKLLSR